MSHNTIQTTNPASNTVIQSYDEMTIEEAGEIIDKTHDAFIHWCKASFQDRSKLLLKVADLLEERKEDLTALMTEEMGKIKTQGISEIEKCAWACRYYAENAQDFLADEFIKTDMDESFITYQPIGVVLAIMPWNFPFWQVFRFAAPTLMAGNGCVLKHASSTTGCGLAIEQIFIDAGFPVNLFRTVLVSGKKATDLIDHDKIRAVTLTGSTKAGKLVAERAGANLKKVVLELGGSDAYLILKDADINIAAKSCAQSRLLNSGQSCIAAKRFIVINEIYDDFVRTFKKIMCEKKMGDPNNTDTDLGPLSSVHLRDQLHDQVEKSVKAGAKCILGGEVPDKKGAWYPQTILTDVTERMPAYTEEFFGPVAIIIRATDVADAIRISNSSEFGLGGGIFTNNLKNGTKIAREELDTGSVAVNNFVKSNPNLPFGGVKNSGYGRELSKFGIQEFVNIKTVTVTNLNN